MNAPMSSMPSGGGPVPFYQVWINALTKPNEQTYADMANSGNAKATTAYLWVFIAALVEFFFVSLVQSAQIGRILASSNSNLPVRGVGLTLITAVCGAPIVAVIIVVFFAVGVAIIQWIARMFGGRASFDQMAYVFGAIYAPFLLVSTVFNLFGAIPFVGLCFRVVLGLAGLYIVVLQIMAVKGVNQIGWGQAAGSVLIPGFAVFLVCCCLGAVAGAAGGVALRNIIQQFRPGLGQ